MALYNELIDRKELLDFSQGLSIARPAYLGSRLFPDQKTQYIHQEYTRLAENGNLPQIAAVHAFDTEANIASRIPMEKVEVEELLIKEKINQTENIRRLFRGFTPDNVKDYVFDDAARLFEKIIARAEKAKIDAITTGKYTITENNLNMVIDYGIPEENKVSTLWDADADILGDLREWRMLAIEKGVTPNRAITTEAVVTTMMTNAGIQKAIFGTSGTGILPTLAQINTLLQAQVGITVETYEQRYAVASAVDGQVKLTPQRFFPENTFVMLSTGMNGTLGIGLWGVTPEEEVQGGAFDSKRQQQFVTITQWEVPDPATVWTKASGVFMPIMPNVYGHIIANVATADESEG